jgi:hypothetical protein
MSNEEFKDLIDSSEKIVTYEKFSAMRKAREEIKTVPLAFEPGCYYVFPDMGLFTHVLFITDKSTFHDLPIYIMEDNHGNLFCEEMTDDVTIGWHQCTEEVWKSVLNFPDDDPAPAVS